MFYSYVLNTITELNNRWNIGIRREGFKLFF